MTGSGAPRVLIVGNFWHWSMEWSYARALESLGARVDRFDWWSESLRAAPHLAERRFMWRALSPMTNARLRGRVLADRPDIVLVFKGLLLHRATVEAVRSAGALAFCLNPDNPFNPSLTSTRPELVGALPSWDCYFTWGRFLVDRLYAVGVRRVEYLPFAWDPERHPFQPPAEEPRYGVSFAGTYSFHRERWLRELRGKDLHIWGPRWKEAAPDLAPHVRGAALTWRQFSDVVRDSVVSLNVLDPFNVPGHNMRTFEIPGCGGAELCTASGETGDLFQPGKEILTFRTADELRAQVDWALDHPRERREVAGAGHRRAESHTYRERAGRVLTIWREETSR